MLYLYMKYHFCITKLKRGASISLNCMHIQLKKETTTEVNQKHSNQFLLLFNYTHVQFIEIESHLNLLSGSTSERSFSSCIKSFIT